MHRITIPARFSKNCGQCYLPAIAAMALIFHGLYYLTSTPARGYTPSSLERLSRLGRGVVTLACGFIIGTSTTGRILFSEKASGSFGPACVSATSYGRAEDIGVSPIVIPKFKLRNIQGQTFTADLVIGPDDAALDERPEAFNRVRVNCANNVLAGNSARSAIPRLRSPLPASGSRRCSSHPGPRSSRSPVDEFSLKPDTDIALAVRLCRPRVRALGQRGPDCRIGFCGD